MLTMEKITGERRVNLAPSTELWKIRDVITELKTVAFPQAHLMVAIWDSLVKKGRLKVLDEPWSTGPGVRMVVISKGTTEAERRVFIVELEKRDKQKRPSS